VPHDLLPDLHKAKIVLTNYHAFKLREAGRCGMVMRLGHVII
jgi:hypothetical protein